MTYNVFGGTLNPAQPNLQCESLDYFSGAMATQQPGHEPSCQTRFWESYSSMSMRHGSTMSVNSISDWLTFWRGLQQNIADAAVSKWRKHLQAHVCPEGGHCEHLLYTVSTSEWTINRYFMDSVSTRSPAVARISDRTAPVVKLTLTLTLILPGL